MSDINSFQRKIEIFIDDIADGKLFFPTLKKYEEDQPNAKVSHASFLDRLKDNFEARFEDFKLDRIVLAGLVDPFGIKYPLDFGTKAMFLSGLTFQQLLQRLLTAGGYRQTRQTDYRSFSESAFSKMNFIKNKYRSTLTDARLHQLMRISLTELTPNFKKMAQSSMCHLSH